MKRLSLWPYDKIFWLSLLLYLIIQMFHKPYIHSWVPPILLAVWFYFVVQEIVYAVKRRRHYHLYLQKVTAWKRSRGGKIPNQGTGGNRVVS